MRKMQHQTTGQFDKMKNGCALAEFQDSFEPGLFYINICHKGGMCITHLAAAYN
jgi:hypothetical protein